jgi:tetratricopeptide (TPR) repeat protein
VAISQGSSGGGLFNAEGELVGITTFYLKEGQSLNFALPVEWIGQVAGKKIRERPRVEAPAAPAPGARPKEYWENRAVALEKAQDWQGMLAWCRRWTQTEPGNDLAWYILGVAYAKLGRHREAIEAYREVLRLKPDDAMAWYNLGFAYGKLGRYREEIEAYRESLRLKPDDASAWNNLAVTYFILGNRSAALEAVKELRRYNPQKADKLFNLIMKP